MVFIFNFNCENILCFKVENVNFSRQEGNPSQNKETGIIDKSKNTKTHNTIKYNDKEYIKYSITEQTSFCLWQGKHELDFGSNFDTTASKNLLVVDEPMPNKIPFDEKGRNIFIEVKEIHFDNKKSKVILLETDHETFANERYMILDAFDSSKGSSQGGTTTTPAADRSLTIKTRSKLNPDDHKENVYYLGDPLKKLGDGSFGVVYEITDGNNNKFALKVLYQRQFTTRSGAITLHRKCFENFKNGGSRENLKKDVDNSQANETTTISELLDATLTRLSKKDQSADETKICLYELLSMSADANNISKARYNQEKGIDEKIRETYASRNHTVHDPGGYIKPCDYTDKFTESNAFNFIKNQRKGTANLSKYAIVMEYCDLTLLDILEKRWVVTSKKSNSDILNTIQEEIMDNKHGNDGKNNVTDPPLETTIYHINGYSLIRALDFKYRESVILPFIEGCGNGLSVLHSAGQLHHDIKPGNIFIKYERNKFNVLLGDFSFLEQAAQSSTTEVILRDAINTGTVHYRSPEQRDHLETYQASVHHSIKGDDAHVYSADNELSNKLHDECFYLRVIDPKFSYDHTNMTGKVVFSTDSDGVVYPIAKVMKHNAGLYSDIWIYIDTDNMKNLREKFDETNKTQITIYKMPTVKADIFGYGGIMYDLITGGLSPETFYESIRSIDIPGSPGTVAGIMEKYKQYTQNEKVVSPYVDIFKVFKRNDHDFASEWVVEVIFKCMASNLKDSYHVKHFADTGLQKTEIGRDVARAIDEAYSIVKDEYRKAEPIQELRHLLIQPSQSVEWNKVLKNYNFGEIKGKDESNVQQNPGKSKFNNLLEKVKALRKRIWKGIWH